MADGVFHTKAQVAAKFKNIVFGTDSKVKDTELEAEIARTEAYVEGKIDPFYVFADMIPVGSPTPASLQPKSYLIVCEICLYLTVAKVNEILRKNGVENQNPEEKQKILNEYARAEKTLKGIAIYITQGNVEGAVKLPDGTARSLATTSSAGGYDTSEVKNQPQFQKGVKQW